MTSLLNTLVHLVPTVCIVWIAIHELRTFISNDDTQGTLSSTAHYTEDE